MKNLTVLMLPALLVLGGMWTVSADEEQAAPRKAPLPGQITETELGDMLSAIGLKPTKTEQRYDFAFKTSYRGEEWKFSMSAVLSRNGESVWVMAWLDQIPQSSAEVPRTALLRLLAANDRLGGGKFFAYIPTNKRFVMQRVLDNRDMTNRKMQEILQDLAASVADEYPTWATTNWTPKAEQQVAEGAASDRGVPVNPTTATKSAAPTKTAVPAKSAAPAKLRTSDNSSKFEGKTVN